MEECSLSSEHHQRFVECVELFEDAINHLRLGKIVDAERTAYGALLLQHHLWCLLNDEPNNLKGFDITRLKLTPEGNAVRGLIDTLGQLRQIVSGSLVSSDQQTMLNWNKIHDQAEVSLNAGNDALIDKARAGIERLELFFHKRNYFSRRREKK